MSDSLKKFLFEDRSVRIESVQLTQTWLAAQAHHTYPPSVAALLGELVAAATLLSATLKIDGSLILQLQGDGAIALMVLDPPKHTPGRQIYQGIVPLEGDTIAAALEQYMLRSEQLDTRIWLAADSRLCTGLLLQRLPVQGGNQQAALSTAHESWERAQQLAQTLNQSEMLDTDQDTLLHRLFWDEPLHSFEPRTITWRCSCSYERVADMLRMLGKPEVQDMFEERDSIDIACEFCGQPYSFDATDALKLFSAVH